MRWELFGRRKSGRTGQTLRAGPTTTVVTPGAVKAACRGAVQSRAGGGQWTVRVEAAGVAGPVGARAKAARAEYSARAGIAAAAGR